MLALPESDLHRERPPASDFRQTWKIGSYGIRDYCDKQPQSFQKSPGTFCAISDHPAADRTLPFPSQVIHPTNKLIAFELI